LCICYSFNDEKGDEDDVADDDDDDDASTATASDVDNTDSAPELALHYDSDVVGDTSCASKAATASSSSKTDQDRVIAESQKDVQQPPFVMTSLPTVRLERLNVDKTNTTTPSETIPSAQKLTLAVEHNYFSTSEVPQSGVRESRTSGDSRTSVTDNDSTVDVERVPSLPASIAADHCYCVPFLPAADDVAPTPVRTLHRKPKRRLSDVTNIPGSRELSSILTPVAVAPPRPHYEPRDLKSEIMILLEFILGGVDAEDIMFLRRRYEQLLQFDSASTAWLNDTHWVDHPTSFFLDPLPQPPARKRRKVDVLDDQSSHLTGRLSVNHLHVVCAVYLPLK